MSDTVESRNRSSFESAIARAIPGELEAEILVVNRDPEVRLLLQKALYVGNFSSTTVATRDEALTSLRRGSYGAVVVSIESSESLELMEEIRRVFPRMILIAFSRAATPELVRDVLRSGADDFVFGTFDAKSLHRRLRDLFAAEADGRSEPARESPVAEETKREGAPGAPFKEEIEIICKNGKMQKVLDIAGRIAPTDSTVLIQGESGTGKELVARWLHAQSQRADGPFVEVNCGALPENLLESQLFGHEKGSFTGAIHRQLGLFEVADRGTIFLDEIGEMGLDMQVKLLRVLQSREFRRIGGSHVVKVDVRVIAATNRELKVEVERGRFRTDLFYRLNVISLEIPPLRERLDEIPVLVESFCDRLAETRGLPRKRFTARAIEALQSFGWEGNVRELENATERLVLLTPGDTIDADDIGEHLVGTRRPVTEGDSFAVNLSLDEVKRLHIARVLRENGGNKMRTARILKINVKTLYNLIKSLDVPVAQEG